MENEQKQLKIWRLVAIIAICLLAGWIICDLSGVIKHPAAPASTAAPAPASTAASAAAPASSEASGNVSAKSMLASWTEGAASTEAFTSYIDAVTKKDSPDYIPVEDRVAVFDLDGTLFCETDPGYFDHMLLYHRVMEDPDYKDKATEAEKKAAGRCKEYFESRKYPEGLDIEHGTAVATSFAGMTIREFYDYVKAYRNTPANGYTGMNKGDGFYKPMVEIVNCLLANDFKVYIISGTDRLIVRGLFEDNILNVPPEQIIGSDERIVARHQDGKDGLDYMYTDQDELILAGEFITKNLKMNKVSVISREIGKQPVLSFGNSSGDNSMAEYTITNNKYKSLAFMLCCDDLVRENGKEDAARKMEDSCKQYGWIPVSMKNDWKTIYGDGVTRKQQ